MTDERGRVALTRRQLLGSAITVGVAGAGLGAGTSALFVDTESSTTNAVRTGTLDLTVNGSDQTITFLDATNVAPGDNGSATVTLGNVGTLAGDPTVEVAATRSLENGFSGSENGQDPSANDGELDAHLELRFSLAGQTVFGSTTATNLAVGDTFTVASTIAGGGSMPFTVEWWLPNDTSDLAQSDGFEFDLTFRLDQAGGP